MTAPSLDPADAYHRLIELLDSHQARYRELAHVPEGRTEVISPIRGNDLAAAAKCMVVMVKLSKKERRYVLAVIPGDRRVDFEALKQHVGGTYAGFAQPEIAERLSGCVVGTVLPFSWHPELTVVVDPALYKHEEIFFNAGRLDRSLALDARDHRAIAVAVEVSISS